MITTKVLQTIKANQLIQSGQTVIVGYSGGHDSTGLAAVLLDLQQELKINLHLAHLNHQIRPEADAEVKHVQQMAEQLQLPITCETRNIPKLAELQRTGIEEAARYARYEFYGRLARQVGAQVVALGHHADDQVETILMRLMRGAGLRGLQGIPIKRALTPEISVVRPLLDVTREEIIHYIKTHQLSFILDHSNADQSILRNRIRHELLPLLEKDYSRNIRFLLRRTAHLINEDEEYLDDIATRELAQVVTLQNMHTIRLSGDLLLKQAPNMQKRLLRKGIETIASLNNIQFNHLNDIITQLQGANTRWKLDLPGALYAGYADGELILSTEVIDFTDDIEFKYLCQLDATTDLPEITHKVHLRKIYTEEPMDYIIKHKTGQYVDLDRIDGNIYLRSRQDGDRFFPLGALGSKKVKDYFIDKKIPFNVRNRIPILVDQNKIIAVVGQQIDDRSRVTPETRNLLRIECF